MSVLDVKWTTDEAIELCKLIEPIAARCGCHIGLTGGLLYKEGPRKDCDLVIYSIRSEVINFKEFYSELSKVGVNFKQAFGFVTKVEYKGKSIDILYPEDETYGEYDHIPTEDIDLSFM